MYVLQTDEMHPILARKYEIKTARKYRHQERGGKTVRFLRHQKTFRFPQRGNIISVYDDKTNIQ